MRIHPDPLPPHVYTDAAYLATCTPKQACDWLEGRSEDHPVIFDGMSGREPDRVSKLVEYILLRRRDPLIDVALARFGRNSDILRKLYRRARKSVRVTICRNPFCFVVDHWSRQQVTNWTNDPFAWAVVLHGSDAELQALCEQPELRKNFYSDLIRNWSGHPDCKAPSEQQIPDERFRSILLYLAGNPRSGIAGGFPSEAWERYRYGDFDESFQFEIYFKLVVGLAELVPKETPWARCLATLYGKMDSYWFTYDDPESLLDRWRPPSFFGSGPFDDLRLVLAKFLLPPTLETMDHEDPMIRRAFYQTFDPLAADMTNLDWEAWCERDDCFFDLLENKNVWQTWELRSRLHSLARDIKEVIVYRAFDAHETNMRAVHPEFFEDEDQSMDEIESDGSDTIVEMKETLQKLEDQSVVARLDDQYLVARTSSQMRQLKRIEIWAVFIIILLMLGLADR